MVLLGGYFRPFSAVRFLCFELRELGRGLDGGRGGYGMKWGCVTHRGCGTWLRACWGALEGSSSLT